MDILLFDRYGLKLSESDPGVIASALEASKEGSNWVKNLNAKNDRILSKAKSEQAKWESDVSILKDNASRQKASDEISRAVKKVVDYIDNHSSDENRFNNAEAAFADLGLKADEIAKVYEKYRADFSSIIDPQLLEIHKNVARQMAMSLGEYSKLISTMDDNIISKFYELGTDISSMYSALKLKSCRNALDISANSERLSSQSYEIYSKKLLNEKEKNAFMDIFSNKSNSQCALRNVLVLDSVNDFSQKGWILFKYIPLTCRLMDSKSVSTGDFEGVPGNEQMDYAFALEKLFGVKSAAGGNNSYAQSQADNSIPTEVRIGNSELSKGNFDNAYKMFNTAASKDPYCWQSYWGMFKAATSSKDDKSACFPGFIEKYRRRQYQSNLKDIFYLYDQAKYNASAQRSREINFKAIEDRFEEADRKSADFFKFLSFVKKAYEEQDTANIPNKEYSAKFEEFKNMTEHYKKEKDKSEAFILNLILIVLGVTLFVLGVILAVFHNSTETVLSIGIAAAVIITVIVSLFLDLGGFTILTGLVALAISGGLAYLIGLIIDGIGLVAAVIILIIVGGGLIAFYVKRKIDQSKIAKGLPAIKEEAENYLKNEILACYIKDIDRYYSGNNLAAFRVALEEKDLNITVNKYFEMFGDDIPTE